MKITAFRQDKRYSSVVCADDLEILAASKVALEHTREDLTTSDKDLGLDKGHSKTNGSSTQKLEIPWLGADTEMEQCREKFASVEICMTLTSNSAPVVQHRMLCGKNRTCTTRKRFLDLPIALFVEQTGSIGAISMAESVVESCCAAPGKLHGKKN